MYMTFDRIDTDYELEKKSDPDYGTDLEDEGICNRCGHFVDWHEMELECVTDGCTCEEFV